MINVGWIAGKFRFSSSLWPIPHETQATGWWASTVPTSTASFYTNKVFRIRIYCFTDLKKKRQWGGRYSRHSVSAGISSTDAEIFEEPGFWCRNNLHRGCTRVHVSQYASQVQPEVTDTDWKWLPVISRRPSEEQAQHLHLHSQICDLFLDTLFHFSSKEEEWQGALTYI